MARLHDLEVVLNGGGESGASEREAEDGPIDAALAADLIGRMKALPRSDVEEILR